MRAAQVDGRGRHGHATDSDSTSERDVGESGVVSVTRAVM